jgi:hypothetical protein
MTIVDLLSERQLEQLQRVFRGRQKWSFELYEPLRAFAHAYERLARSQGLAPLTFGDALVAVDALLAREQRPSWVAKGEPGGAAFATLGFGETSEGIGRAQAQNRVGWSLHAQQNRALVEQAMKQLPGSSALVLGAGKAFDLPLRLLAEHYERLVLVDIDGAALAATARRFLGDPLPRCVELVTWDVTGIAHAWPGLVGSAIAAGGSEQQTREKLIALLSSYRLSPPAALFESTPGCVDVAYSCMILSQLATPLTEHAVGALEQRFVRKEGPPDPTLQRALRAFTHRVQHSHLQALLACARSVVLSSDVTERYTRLSTGGLDEPISGELPLIGTERLDELLPILRTRVLAGAEWHWQRVAATASRVGSTLRVHGVVAQTA